MADDYFLKPRPPAMGSWWLRSRSHRLWNCRGRGLVGGGGWRPEMPEGVKEEIQWRRERLGEPPADLEFGYKRD